MVRSGSRARRIEERQRVRMSGKKAIELKPVRTGKTDPKTFARQAREIADP